MADSKITVRVPWKEFVSFALKHMNEKAMFNKFVADPKFMRYSVNYGGEGHVGEIPDFVELKLTT